jgi:hypothetical protein
VPQDDAHLVGHGRKAVASDLERDGVDGAQSANIA